MFKIWFFQIEETTVYSAQRYLLSTTRWHSGCFFNLKKSGFKHFVISQKLLGQSTWVSTRCAQQVALRRIHCCFFNLKKSGFKHFVISQKLLGQSTWVSTRCAQQVALPRKHRCFFNLLKSGFKHFVISQKLLGQSTWVQRIVLSR